ncbi:hypothetical protein AXF42_Ash001311 [Apostasia shenzhenica]|uniref:Uncharacterized protein n=1 Tax=Apostasia shenzhenica TaxID=1088818 RepID=A0A2I0AUK0_9ASPA|nr:hypothetical protein AXF42_Ash001311 [Apostasia shenzhenica]
MCEAVFLGIPCVRRARARGHPRCFARTLLITGWPTWPHLVSFSLLFISHPHPHPQPTHFSLFSKDYENLAMAAARNQQVLKHTIRLFSSRSSGKEGLAAGGSSVAIVADDFDESDIFWAGSSPPARPRTTWKKNIVDGSVGAIAAGSLPLSIPDRPRMLRNEEFEGAGRSAGMISGRRSQDYFFDEEEEEEEEPVVPPHEMLWRRRPESFSVVEGIGRTLKGRDLSRVRDGVWAQIGFQD